MEKQEIIFKYGLKVDQGTVLSLPKGAEILSVKLQNDIPMLWVLIDQSASNEIDFRTFVVYKTGEHLSPMAAGYSRHYIDTFLAAEGAFVGHVFEIKKTIAITY